MKEDFYRAFEEKHRGSRELIKSRLKAYKPFLMPVLAVYPKASAIDLGCGRGEWLEYIGELGFSGHGVDLDEGMLSACVELGLSAEKRDLIEYVSGIESNSVGLVTAFHVVEHIPFNDLRLLVEEVARALKPGGLMILETPNPENILVASRDFYLDPTHQKPIPPKLLAFVAEFAGFGRIKTMRLQEPAGLLARKDINVIDVLGGVSPDYAVVAQKYADPDVMSGFDEAFDRNYGITLDALAGRFESKLSNIEAKAIGAEQRASEAEAAIQSMVNSRSWRITAPIRIAGDIIRTGRESELRSKLRMLPHHARRFFNQRPRLKRLMLRVLNGFRRIRSRLVRIFEAKSSFGKINYTSHETELVNFSPRARRIYQDLKSAIKGQRKQR